MVIQLGVTTPLYCTPENNKLPYFQDTALSVLKQDVDFRWVIVDDGSTDPRIQDFLQAISQDQRVVILPSGRKPDDYGTASRGLNIGFYYLFEHDCRAFCYVHEDDLLTQGSLEGRLSILDGKAMAHGKIASMIEGKIIEKSFPPKTDFTSLSIMGYGFGHHTSLWSRAMIEVMLYRRSGKIFDETLNTEDLDATLFSRRIMEDNHFSLAYTDAVVYIWRDNPRNLTHMLSTWVKNAHHAQAYKKNDLPFGILAENVHRPLYWLPESLKKHLRPLKSLAHRLSKGFFYSATEMKPVEIDPFWFRNLPPLFSK